MREEYKTKEIVYENAMQQGKRINDNLQKTIIELKEANDSLAKYQLDLQSLRGLFIKSSKHKLEYLIANCKERISNAELKNVEAEKRFQEVQRDLSLRSDLMELTYTTAASYLILKEYKAAYDEYKKISG